MAFGASVCFVQQIEAGTPTENYFPLFGVDNSNAKIAESLTLSPIDFAALEEANVVDSSAEISEQTKLKNFFNERAARWEKESKIHSSPGSKFLNKDYIGILSKGESIVPLILKRLETSNCDWLWALENIIPEEENPAKGIENFKDAKQAWLEWGSNRYS